MIIRCYETPEGREMELIRGVYSITITERGTVRPYQGPPMPLDRYIEMLEQAAALDFEATWASHFEGVPYAPGDRTEA
jgi:hypothetical protein